MVLREVDEAVLTEEEVVAEVVEVVGEEEDIKMIEGTNNLSLNKVGRILLHLIHIRLFILQPQILVLHLQILVLHLQNLVLHLQILQAVVIQPS